MKSLPVKKPGLSRRTKLAIWLGGAVVLYTVVGFLVAPAVVKAQMLKRLPVMLKRPVAVGEVKVNPYTLEVTITGLAVKETDGSPFAGLDQLFVGMKFSSFFHRGWSFEEISMIHPTAHVSRARDGKINFDDIVATLAAGAPTPAGKKTPLPLVMIDNLHIDDAIVTVDDAVPPKPVHTQLRPINLKLHAFSTLGSARNPYEFSAKSDTAESFQWTGTFTLEPLQVSGNFKITGLDLKKYSPYLSTFANVNVVDGKVEVGADYTAGLGSNDLLELSVTNGVALVQSLSVKSSETGETVISVPSASVALAEADLVKKLIHVTSVETTGGSLLVRQEHDGKINLLAMLKLPTNSAPAASASQKPWTAVVDAITVTRYAVSVEDKKPVKAAKLSVDGLDFTAKGFSTAGKEPIATTFNLRIGESGRLSGKGSVQLQPLGGDVDVELLGVDLRPFQPYVEDQQIKVSINRGLVSAKGHARYSTTAGTPMLAYEGSFGLTNLATTDLIQFKDFVKLDGLSVSGIKCTVQPMQVEVAEVNVSGLNTTAIMDTNHQINLLSVLPPSAPAPATTAAAPSSKSALPFPVSLAKLTIDNASFHLIDQSIEPNCYFDIQELDGTVTGLSSQPESRATVDMHGKVDEVSSFSVSGSANPLNKDMPLDIAVACKNTDLTPFTPYMERFGGYPLQRGKLLVNVKASIDQRKLNSSNHVVIAGITLGPRNGSTNAVHLPVKLGIALLKDRAGNINLDVPVAGSLDSPDFAIWPIVWKVFGNVLAKAATSPFTLLGSMFGGGEELSYVDFAPGHVDFAATEQAKIDKLSKALFERPALQLEIAATADPVTDGPALARLKLDDQIRSVRIQELISNGTPAETASAVTIDAAENQRLLKILYAKSVGTNVSASATTNSAPISSAASVEASRGPTNVPPVAVALAAAVEAKRRTLSNPGTIPTAPTPTADAFAKGGEVLVWMTSPVRNVFNVIKGPDSFAPATVPPRKAAPSPAANPVAPAVPSSAPVAAPVYTAVDQATVEQMRAQLLAGIHVTEDDLRELMQNRAKSVQAALVKSGKVEGERLFILAPKPISTTAQGQARVNLTLD